MCHAPAALLYYSTAMVEYCYDKVLKHGLNSFGSVMHAIAAALCAHMQACNHDEYQQLLLLGSRLPDWL